jgi:hypothetical protein
MVDEAITEWHANNQAREAVLSAAPTGPALSPFFPNGFPDKASFAADMQAHLDKHGDKRTRKYRRALSPSPRLKRKSASTSPTR